MKVLCSFVAFALCEVACAASLSQVVPTPQEQSSSPQPIKVFHAGRDVSEPELVPLALSDVVDPACDKRKVGNVEVAMIVDPTGNSNDILLSRPLGNILDRLAVEIAVHDHFKPGEKNGKAVAVSITVKMHLEICMADAADNDGNKSPRLKLSSQPVQNVGSAWSLEPSKLVIPHFKQAGGEETLEKIGGRITPPIPIHTPSADFTPEATRNRIQGVCLIRLIVDAQGLPRNPIVVKPIGYGLDEAAIAAVKNYRFRPAMKEGNQPVAVMMSIEVNFRQ
jgi:TonB family protein